MYSLRVWRASGIRIVASAATSSLPYLRYLNLRFLETSISRLSMPLDPAPPRQAPASCESCRRKKLRCDRTSPCHNCTTRLIQCVYTGRKPRLEGSGSLDEQFSALYAENATIKERLQKLEATVLHTSTSSASSATADALRISSPPAVVTTESPHSDAPVLAYPPSLETEPVNNYSEDSRTLEDISSQNWAPLPRVAHNLVPHITSLPALIKRVVSEPNLSSILLPSMDQVLYLLDTFAYHLNPLQHGKS